MNLQPTALSLQQQLEQQQEQQKLLIRIAQQTRSTAHLTEILNTSAAGLRNCLKVDRVLVYQVSAEAEEHPGGKILAESVALHQPTLADLPLWNTDVLIQANASDGTSAIVNPSPDTLSPAYRQLLHQLQVTAQVIMPIWVDIEPNTACPSVAASNFDASEPSCSPMWGLLIIHQTEVEQTWNEADLNLIEAVVGQVSIALYQIDLRQQLQQEREERRHTETMHRAILDALPDLIIRLNRDGTYLDFRPSSEFPIIMPYARMQGINIRQVMPANIAEERLRHVEQTLQSGKNQIYEYPIEIEGQVHWQESRIVVSGQDEVLAIIRDVTDRKQAEIERQQAQLELEHQRTLLRTIINAAPIMIYLKDAAGRYLLGNKAIADLLQTSVEEMIGQTSLDLGQDPALVEQFQQQNLQILKTHKAMFIPEEKVVIHQQEYWLQWYKCPIYLSELKTYAVLGIGMNITDLKQAEAELKQLNQELEDRVQLRTLALQSANNQLQQEVRVRRMAEVLLRASQSRFQKLATNVPGVIYQYLLLPSGADKMPYASSGMKDLFELEADAVIADVQLLWDLIHPEDAIRMRESIRISAATLQPWQHEFRVTTSSGQRKWIQGNSRPEQLKDGAILWDGLLIDVSERRQTEAALRESEERFRLFVEHAPAAVAMFDRQVRYLAVSRRWLTDYRLENQPILGRSHYEVFSNLPEYWRQVHQRCLQGAVETCEEEQFQNTDGCSEWLRWAVHPWHTSNGEIGGIIMFTEIITERKHIQDTLRQQIDREHLITAITQRIRETLDLPTILNTTVIETKKLLGVDRVLVYRLDAEGQGLAIAESSQTEIPLLLHTSFWFSHIPQSYVQDCQNCIHTITDCNQPHEIYCLNEFLQSVGAKAGILVPIVQQEMLWGFLVVHHCASVRNWQSWETQLLQQLVNHLSIAIQQSELYEQLQAELQERKRAQEQLKETNHRLLISNTQLERATRLKDEFLANMSHELRTPLNAILGMAEALLDEICGSLNERQKKSIATIERSGKHLLDLINDILDLAKIEAGKLDLQITLVPVNQLCTNSLNLVSPIALKKNIHIKTQIPDQLGGIAVDQRRMQQVLLNLLSNAVKFTPEEGEVTLKIHIEPNALSYPETNDAQISFSIIDTGIGIDQTDLGNLFQSFVQIDSSLNRQYSGTGLGLVLVKRLTELHGGQVFVESQIGQGSCFTVQLPCQFNQVIRQRKESSIEQPQNEETLPAMQPFSVASSQTASFQSSVPDRFLAQSALILLAEDNEANIETFSTYLIDRGYRLIVARTGLEAVAMAKQRQPDLILMDIQMPTVSGLEAVYLTRTYTELAAVPIIALTALVMPGDCERCLAAGANDYLAKPVSLKELAELINKYLSLPKT